MRTSWKVGGAVAGAMLLGWACGGGGGSGSSGGGSTFGGGGGGGVVGGPDGGSPRPDAGVVADAGTVPDAGPADAGPPPPVTIPQNADGWTFYGPQQGGPREVYGASLDEGGNLWVAGGEEGLFLLRAGATQYEHFTMADGLRPYGYMFDGSEPPGDKYLKVISVSGGWAGTVFVGYQGKPLNGDPLECESNWDGPSPDPSIYKSGDADRVTLNGAGGIDVVHYDISSGQGIVGNELRGREKLCNVLRIRYDKLNDRVWFGANHGFAMGDAHYAGTGKCQWAASTTPTPPTSKTSPFSNDPGHYGCSGVLEHTHPAIQGLKSDGTCCALLTGGYYGVSVDPVTKDVWFGGQMRTTKFHYGSNGGNYYASQSQTEDPGYEANRIDIWPDLKPEGQQPSRDDRVDDSVSGAAAMADGSVWLSSFKYGIAHLDQGGQVVARAKKADGLVADKFSSIAADPTDQSVWAGANSGGISRLKSGSIVQYGGPVFGFDLSNQRISDLQPQTVNGARQMVVSFGGNDQHSGAVGIFSGP